MIFPVTGTTGRGLTDGARKTMENAGIHPDTIELFDAVISGSNANGGLKRVAKAVQKAGVNINGYPYPNRDHPQFPGIRAIEYSAFGGDVDMLQFLLKHNADPNLNVSRSRYELLTQNPDIRALLPLEKQTFVDETKKA